MIIERNKKAKQNGSYAEEIAKEILNKKFDKVEFVNQQIDFICNNKLIEVKSCSEFIKDNYNSTKKRKGRFTFNKDQHDYLVKNNGLYLLIVFDSERKVKKVKFINAKDINYKYQIRWDKIIGE